LPIGVQEGLAVIVSRIGRRDVEEVARKIRRSHVDDLVGEFNRPYPYLSKAQWAPVLFSDQIHLRHGRRKRVPRILSGRIISGPVPGRCGPAYAQLGMAGL